MDEAADQDSLDPATNLQFRAEIEAARAWGVSWKRFCGFEPVQRTTYRYDDAGRLVEAVTVTDSEWDDEQREAVFALMRFEAGLCPGCHEPIAETTNPANEFAYEEAETLRCFRCQTTEVVQATYGDDKHPGSLLLRIVRAVTGGHGG